MLDGNEDDNAARGEKAVADEESLESDENELLNDEEESTEDEDEEVDEDEDEEENEDEEEEEEEDVELEGSEGSETSETDESTEGDTSDSDGSVWSTRGEIIEATHEAEEALSMRNFHRALELMIENKEEKAVEIFKKLLRKSYISRFERPIDEIFFDEDITEDKENKLSKMGKLFVAIHKNLAKLEEDQAIYHYLQVLNLAPNNPEVWFDVAIKSVHTGDLNFAKSAFRKCDFVDSAEARATTLFISYDYKECLTVLREFEERGHSLNDKMIFLKNSIRSSSDYHKELCDEIFQENERYNGIKTIHMTKMNEYKSRIEALENKIRKANEEKCADIFKEETLEPVFLDIFYDQDLETVGTIFCDLYDRIEAFSSLHRQKIVFREWGDRRMYFDVKETLEEILDVVEVVEDLTEKVSRKAVRQRKSEFTWSWTPRAAPTVRIFEPSTSQDSSPAREEDSECDSGCETTTTSDEDVEMALKVVLPKSDLATSLRLSCSTSFEPIEPPKIDKELLVVEDVKFFDDEAVLEKLRGTLMGREMRMFDVLEAFLLTICDFCPNQGAVPKELKLVLTQCYRRLINIDKRLMESKYLELHQLMYELDELEAQTYCRRAFSEDFPFFSTEDQLEEDFEPENQLYLRFWWKYAFRCASIDAFPPLGLDNPGMYHIELLAKFLNEEQVVLTANGSFSRKTVINVINQAIQNDLLDAAVGSRSEKDLEELNKFFESDQQKQYINFSTLSPRDWRAWMRIWLDVCLRLKHIEEFCVLCVRLLCFIVTHEELNDQCDGMLRELALTLVDDLAAVDWKNLVKPDLTSSIGYFLCVLSTWDELQGETKLWFCLADVVRACNEDVDIIGHIESLDRIKNADSLPTLELFVLLSAHRKLGDHGSCCENEGQFLLHYIDKIRDLIERPEVLECLLNKENAWLWENVQSEIAQCLGCLFGKYSKKRKPVNQDDHNCPADVCKLDVGVARRILPVAMNFPLPLYDDKERLGHDVVDLITTKFEFILKVDEDRQKVVENSQLCLSSSNSHNIEEFKDKLENLMNVEEEDVQAQVWYVMALNSYRQSDHPNAQKYSELYLTSPVSLKNQRLRASAWAILAHEHVHALFLMEAYDMYEQWRWRIMPFRMALDAEPNEAIIHFELAATLYQLATSLSRFMSRLEDDDYRKNRKSSRVMISELRNEARRHFDECLAIALPTHVVADPETFSNTTDPHEFQWLCYFFIAKLNAKEKDYDVVKVIDGFFEAACACELLKFYYPLKINVSKQTHIEPVEVHYQAHAAAWKYISQCENPPVETLVKLLAYLRTFQAHKVVKNGNSLFSTNPELQEVAIELTVMTARNLELEEWGQDDEAARMVSDVLTQTELLEEIEKLCFKGFEVVCERFPHMKAHYRLAEMNLARGKEEAASAHILKNIFKRKKRGDNLFDNVVEISCSDINRVGSFNSHVERCLMMAIRLVAKSKDVATLVSIIITLVTVIEYDDKAFIDTDVHEPLLRLSISVLRRICFPKNGVIPSPDTLKTEIFRLLTALESKQKSKKMILWTTKNWLEKAIIEKLFGNLEQFKMRMTTLEEFTKKRVPKKRKTGGPLDFLPPPPKQPVPAKPSLAASPSVSRPSVAVKPPVAASPSVARPSVAVKPPVAASPARPPATDPAVVNLQNMIVAAQNGELTPNELMEIMLSQMRNL